MMTKETITMEKYCNHLKNQVVEYENENYPSYIIKSLNDKIEKVKGFQSGYQNLMNLLSSFKDTYINHIISLSGKIDYINKYLQKNHSLENPFIFKSQYFYSFKNDKNFDVLVMYFESGCYDIIVEKNKFDILIKTNLKDYNRELKDLTTSNKMVGVIKCGCGNFINTLINNKQLEYLYWHIFTLYDNIKDEEKELKIKIEEIALSILQKRINNLDNQKQKNLLNSLTGEKIIQKTGNKFYALKNNLKTFDGIKIYKLIPFLNNNINEYCDYILNIDLLFLLSAKSKAGNKAVKKYLNKGIINDDIKNKLNNKFDYQI